MPNCIENLIASEYNLRISYDDSLLQDSEMHTLLLRLNKTIVATVNEMESVGVVKECADCAVDGEGTCCGTRTGRLTRELISKSRIPLRPKIIS